MKTLFVCGLLLVFLGAAHADDKTDVPKENPVSIKVVQTADAKGDSVQIEVVNSSPQTVIVDRESLEQPDYTVSKAVTEKGSEIGKDMVMSTNSSAGGRWTVDQLQRREPKRLITILPGRTFTLDVSITKLLNHIDKTYPHGDIELRLTFHDFLLAVGGKDTTDEMFKARVVVERIKINWR